MSDKLKHMPTFRIQFLPAIGDAEILPPETLDDLINLVKQNVDKFYTATTLNVKTAITAKEVFDVNIIPVNNDIINLKAEDILIRELIKTITDNTTLEINEIKNDITDLTTNVEKNTNDLLAIISNVDTTKINLETLSDSIIDIENKITIDEANLAAHIIEYNAFVLKTTNDILKLTTGVDKNTADVQKLITDLAAALKDISDEFVSVRNDILIEKQRIDAIHLILDTKVDKIPGKGLSTNDFTTVLFDKLNNIEDGAQVNVIEKITLDSADVAITGKTVDIDVARNYYSKNELDPIISPWEVSWNTTDLIYEFTTELIGLDTLSKQSVQVFFTETNPVDSPKIRILGVEYPLLLNGTSISKEQIYDKSYNFISFDINGANLFSLGILAASQSDADAGLGNGYISPPVLKNVLDNLNISSTTISIQDSHIGQVYSFIGHIKNPELLGLIEPLDQTLERVDYPDFYNFLNNSLDLNIKSLIISETQFKLPNWIARYLRNYGNANDGEHLAGTPGTILGDAIRNIKTISQLHNNVFAGGATTGTNGPFKITVNPDILGYVGGGSGFSNYSLDFDASTVVPTATENNVYSVSIVYYIKVKNIVKDRQYIVAEPEINVNYLAFNSLIKFQGRLYTCTKDTTWTGAINDDWAEYGGGNRNNLYVNLEASYIGEIVESEELDNPGSLGLVEPTGATVERIDYPDYYLYCQNSPDPLIRSRVVSASQVKLPSRFNKGDKYTFIPDPPFNNVPSGDVIFKIGYKYKFKNACSLTQYDVELRATIDNPGDPQVDPLNNGWELVNPFSVIASSFELGNKQNTCIFYANGEAECTLSKRTTDNFVWNTNVEIQSLILANPPESQAPGHELYGVMYNAATKIITFRYNTASIAGTVAGIGIKGVGKL